ncbi:MAG TPA: DNA-directed RNA polymerase subunit omega [Syntrophomonas sp.]|jgi:DNA-directed RNA polymerase subunit omega|nr:DNA-directed RNA polymerase subunit omega [Syntrophomonas sp.]
MIPPSTKDIMQIASSKYAVVVAVAKRARVLAEQNKSNENNRLSTMVTEALEEISQGKISVELLPDATLKEA